MALFVFIDESMDPMTVVAVVVNESNLFEVERKWFDLLSHYKVPEFHAMEVVQNKGAFKTLGLKRRKQLWDEAFNLVLSLASAGTIKIVLTYRDRPAKFVGLYEEVFKEVIPYFIKHEDDVALVSVIDASDKSRDAALEVEAALYRSQRWLQDLEDSKKKIILPFVESDSKRYAGIQMADMVAYTFQRCYHKRWMWKPFKAHACDYWEGLRRFVVVRPL